MRRWVIPLAIVSGLAGLVVACFGPAIFDGEQFAYRDAGHYYYPLHQRVQAEWDAGRWPLWEPEENGGMPLLGNPTAAVLYPAKVIFALLRYPLAARVYVVGHVLLAFGAMLALCRHWRIGWAGSGLGAMTYAFGGPVLFQHCNVIFLVGAAWLPLGFRAADRLLRQGRTIAMAELAAVLALENLGGDPEAAYLTGVCAAAYAVGLARRGRAFGGWDRWPSLGLAVGAWVVATLAAAHWAPSFRATTPPDAPRGPFPWTPWVGPAVAAAWVAVGLSLVARYRGEKRAGEGTALVPSLFGLGVTAALAAVLSAAQLLPVLEFLARSGRAGWDAAGDIYGFSLHPVRVIEFFWPNVFGTAYRGNRLWIGAIPPADPNVNLWVPTLYLGGLTLVLAAGGLRARVAGGTEPWRPWMGGVAAVSLLGSFGGHGSPVWLARLATGDRAFTGLEGGDGGVYWLMATGLPGFGRFRYPSKLLTLTALGLAVLAARGWDALGPGDPRARRAMGGWAATLLATSLAALGVSIGGREAILSWLRGRNLASWFGPFDAPGALSETQTGLAQAAAVLAIALVLIFGLSGRRPILAGVLALAVTAGDLALANARMVVSVPQSVFDAPPEALAAIARAERDGPSLWPYRLHRAAAWGPARWGEASSSGRVGEFVAWANQTLEPKYGIERGVEYAATVGAAEFADHARLFDGFRSVAGERAARFLGVPRGTHLLVYPRRSFDLWGCRYFVLPYSVRWDDARRGIASFLDRTERVDPAPGAFDGAGGKAREAAWARDHDYQIRRNLDAFPRAWVVHDSRALGRAGRAAGLEELLFSNDLSWPDPARAVFDARRYAWLDEPDRRELAEHLPGGYLSRAEVVRVVEHDPDRVVLEATLERPGVVILADAYDPGWALTIDGRPATVHRANLMMRGAAVPAGRHTLVYRYRPASFRLGLVGSGLGLAGLVLLAARSHRRVRTSRRLAPGFDAQTQPS